uniref:Protein MIX23 n=1 Tax=Meloidogyne javanica TaxID=6303 RepID=A0A915LKG5_MELJA
MPVTKGVGAGSSTSEYICRDLGEFKLLETRKRREDLLQRCINENRETLLRYRNANKQEEDGAKTVNTSKEEMSAYANLRLLREEASVEEIVRVQADKALTDRCRKELLLP